MPLTLLQHRDPDGRRRVIAARADAAHFLGGVSSVRELAALALREDITLAQAADLCGNAASVDPRTELAGGCLLAPIDHVDTAHLILSGTGLTHLGSAEGRDAMHRQAIAATTPTDSMRMFMEGVQGGKPPAGAVGQQPEWFYKGDGSQLVGPDEPLPSPGFALDGSEEPEVAGIYLVGSDGTPHRLGFALANEFSDHVTERHNYLWLAHSKLRPAALGPELLVADTLPHVEGMSRIRRSGNVVWQKAFLSGENNMSHSIANLEAHHFKYAQFRRPGDVHVHFFGTATLSYSDGFRTQEGDIFEIDAAPFTLPLRNRLTSTAASAPAVRTL